MQIESKNPVNDFVAHAIRQIRLERGLKAQDISRLAGIPQGSYSCLEQGRYRLNLDVLMRILEALQVDIGQVWPQARPRTKRPEQVTRSWVRQLVRESARQRPQPISIDDVIEAVCQVAEVSEKDLAGPSRLRNLAQARTLAAFAVRDFRHLTMVDLGRRIRRDTSAMPHVLKRIGTPAPRSLLGMQLGAVRKLLRRKISDRKKAVREG
jgi:transcriptional regulator with XRE-family HTH domain